VVAEVKRISIVLKNYCLVPKRNSAIAAFESNIEIRKNIGSAEISEPAGRRLTLPSSYQRDIALAQDSQIKEEGKLAVQAGFDRRGNGAGAASLSGTSFAARRPISDFAVRQQFAGARSVSRSENWRRRFEVWRGLMVAAQRGQSRPYEKLFRELDVWLRRYYARRLPPAVAEDATQDALLAIHTSRDTYLPSRPFGPWVAAIARYKWIDHVRNTNRFAALPLDDETAIESRDAEMDVIEVGDLLRRLKPAQARAIILVKLKGISIEDASSATGQSSALVKINIHRGLKKLAALATDQTITRATARNTSQRRSQTSDSTRSNGLFARAPRDPAAANETALDNEAPVSATLGNKPQRSANEAERAPDPRAYSTAARGKR
jgi:RNA polymerase sigma factor (sigma-70 family)